MVKIPMTNGLIKKTATTNCCLVIISNNKCVNYDQNISNYFQCYQNNFPYGLTHAHGINKKKYSFSFAITVLNNRLTVTARQLKKIACISPQLTVVKVSNSFVLFDLLAGSFLTKSKRFFFEKL